MLAYKLFRVKKNGQITSLFINKTEPLPRERWLEAQSYPTKGFALRPGWHCTHKPLAPHLSMVGRRWFKVRILDFEVLQRPIKQGGRWYIAGLIKILGE